MKYREGVKITNRNNASAEIISKTGDDLYRVRIRGSEMDPSSCSLEVHKKHLFFLPSYSEGEHEEDVRKRILNQFSPSTNDDEIRDKVFGFWLGDVCCYLIWKHTKPDSQDGLPKEIEETVMTVLAAEYYVLGGRLVNGGRKLTSYAKALKPFVTVKEEVHRAAITVGTPNTGEKIVSWFESLVLTSPPTKSASLFFRALAYGQWRMDNRPSEDDNLLDAFHVAFAAIQIITGNGSSPKMQSCKKEIQESINTHFQKYGVSRVTLMDYRNLVWCLCKLFLDVGMIVRDKIATNLYQVLLPDPYRDTITEQMNIANLCFESRRENHPCSYYAAYKMIMDVKDLVSPSCANNLLSNALKIVRLGKDAAIKSSNNYFSFVFLSIESFWIPTSLWPRTDAITYKGMKERWSQAQKFKDQCSKYTEEKLLYEASSYKHQLKAFLKSLTKPGAISTSDDFLISSIQFEPYTYCSVRFANTAYYKPGGKFDRCPTRFTCSFCSKDVSRLLRCSRCERENYCNRECQKMHWKNGHKQSCEIRIL